MVGSKELCDGTEMLGQHDAVVSRQDLLNTSPQRFYQFPVSDVHVHCVELAYCARTHSAKCLRDCTFDANWIAMTWIITYLAARDALNTRIL